MQDRLPSKVLLDETGFYKHVDRLRPTQRAFISLLKDWIVKPRHELVLVSGGPGTGKTFTVVETLQYTRLIQVKMAYTARIAHKIGGKTIHSTLHLPWGKGSLMEKLEKDLYHVDDVDKCLKASEGLLEEFQFNGSVHVVVIDEIGMVSFWLTYWITHFFFQMSKTPVLIVCMGDHNQLRPVTSLFNVFGVSFDKSMEIHRINMSGSVRFRPEYEIVIDKLRAFINRNETDEMFEFLTRTFPVVEEIDSKLLHKSGRALVYRNETVKAYNQFYIQHFPGKRVRLYKIQNGEIYRNEYVDVKSNCDIFVTENGCSSATNGTPLVFLRYDQMKDLLVCKDLVTSLKVDVERNKFKGSFPVVPGFAGTIHKFQGDTIDDMNVVFNFDECKDLNLVYTALSRVRSMDQILAVKL